MSSALSARHRIQQFARRQHRTDAKYKLGYDLRSQVNWSPVLRLEILARTICMGALPPPVTHSGPQIRVSRHRCGCREAESVA